VNASGPDGTDPVFDVVVVGSGFGGSIAALRLAEAGASVLVLERGQRYAPEDFPRDVTDTDALFAPDGLFDVRFFSGLGVVAANGVGGGSLIYANIHIRPDPVVFDDPRWPAGTDRAALDPYYDRVAAMLQVAPVPAAVTLAKRDAFRAAAAAMGRDCFDPDQAVDWDACKLVAECEFGCRHGAKRSVDRTYLAAAESLGAVVRPGCHVSYVRPDPAGYAVVYRESAADGAGVGAAPVAGASAVARGAPAGAGAAGAYAAAGGAAAGPELVARYSAAGREPAAASESDAPGVRGAAPAFEAAARKPGAAPESATGAAHIAGASESASAREPAAVPGSATSGAQFAGASESASAREPAVRERSARESAARRGAAGPGPLRTVVARRVVLAAGTLGTNELLLRSRDVVRSLPALSPRLGEGFSGNGDFLGSIEESAIDLDPAHGPDVTTVIRFFDQAPEFTMAAPTFDAGVMKVLAALGQPSGRWLRPAGPLLWRALPRLVPFAFRHGWLSRPSTMPAPHRGDPARMTNLFAIGRDNAGGRLRLRGGRLDVTWPYLRQNRALVSRMEAAMAEVAAAYGGHFSPLLTWSLFRKIITVHPLGGCRLSDSPEHGVVSPHGEVHGYPGLFVADGSVIPTAIGFHPVMTISALAERTAEAVAASLA
jgi:choline dehydrogenase-like flavoprotein